MLQKLMAIGAGIFIYKLISDKNKNIFVSYHSKYDGKYKNLLKAWSNNEQLSFSFEDISTDTKIASGNKYYIRSVIKKRIKKCDAVLLLIGKETYKREWVDFELETAIKLDKSIIAVLLNENNIKPKHLESGYTDIHWINHFNEKSITKTLNDI